jgi:sugar lactone lactonase YvrE
VSGPDVLTAVPATTAHYGFGEGLRFDEATRSLLWVDLTAGRLHRAFWASFNN